MATDPNTVPVIVGVGEITDRPHDPALGLEPAAVIKAPVITRRPLHDDAAGIGDGGAAGVSGRSSVFAAMGDRLRSRQIDFGGVRALHLVRLGVVIAFLGQRDDQFQRRGIHTGKIGLSNRHIFRGHRGDSEKVTRSSCADRVNASLTAWRTALELAILLAILGAAPPSRAEILPPSVLPGLGTEPAREAVDVRQPPWRGVVRVQTELGLRCTGALVGPRLVLTAAHCLFGRSTGRIVQPSSIHVLSGYTHGQYDGHARAVAVEIGPGFALGPDGRPLPGSPPDADWAVLTLDTRLGTADRQLPLAREGVAAGTPAMLGGYEQDRAQLILADVACHVIGPVRAGNAVMLRHSCAGTRGVSGAPLLGRAADGAWAVIGVASVAWIGAAGGIAVPISTIAAGSAGLH